MMRSMFSGVSGLRTHQTRMDVIGNNIANVNTVGFKSGRVTFQEVFSQTLQGSSAADSNSGRAGTNPMQIGLGVGISAIDTIMTRGSSQRTDNPSDMMIEGDGFFIVRGSNTDTYKFTRAGNFGVDEIGNLHLNGYGVCGWEPEFDSTGKLKDFDTNKAAAPLNLYRDYATGRNKNILGAQPTTKVYLGGNFDASKAVDNELTVPVMVYDTLGNEYKVNVPFKKTKMEAGSTVWTLNPEGKDIVIKAADGTTELCTVNIPKTELTFDGKGNINKTNAVVEVTMTPKANGADVSKFSLDLTSLTNYASDHSVKPTDVNGYPPGTLTTFNIGPDGIISGIYSNGEQQVLGMIALAVFPNPAGMMKVGENLFIPSTNSGSYTKGVRPGSDGSGKLNPGTLEMSNVDLSREFTDMIITQRGFQANSRIITTSDEMLQELVNLKR